MPIATHVTGYVVTATDWNEIVNAFNAITLPIKPGEAKAPLSGVQAAAFDIIESSGAGTAKPVFDRLLYDKATDEGRMWVFRIPDSYVSAPVLKILYYSTGANVAKTCAFNCQVACVTDADAAITAKVFAATNESVTTVPNAAGTMDVASITLTNDDSMTAGDWCCLHLWRDVSNDDADNDIAVIGLVLTYSVN